MAKKVLPSLAAQRALAKFGRDFSVARRARGLRGEDVAERAQVSRDTIRRMEAGDPGVSWGTVVMALQALGEVSRVSALLDLAEDHAALLRLREDVPQRVRKRSGRRDAAAPSAGDGAGDDDAVF